MTDWKEYLASHNIESGCQSCEFFYSNDEIGDYGVVYSSSPECMKHGAYGNLRSFPFHKIMPCFTLGFWFTPFSELFREEEFFDLSIHEVYRDYYLPWRERGASVVELTLWEEEHPRKELTHD